MTVTDMTIHASFLPHDDARAGGPSSPDVKRLGLVWRMEVLRNG